MDILFASCPMLKFVSNPAIQLKTFNLYHVGGRYHSSIQTLNFEDLLEAARKMYPCPKILFENQVLTQIPQHIECIDCMVLKDEWIPRLKYQQQKRIPSDFVNFTQNGQHIVCTKGGSVRICNLPDWTLKNDWFWRGFKIQDVKRQSNSNLFCFAHEYGIIVFNILEIRPEPLQKTFKNIRMVEFHPTKPFLVICAKKLQVFNLQTHETRIICNREFRNIQFSPSGDHLFVTRSGYMHVFETQTWTIIENKICDIPMILNSNGKYMVGIKNTKIQKFDLQTRDWTILDSNIKSYPIPDLSFDPSGKYIVCPNYKNLKFIDVKNQKTFNIQFPPGHDYYFRVFWHFCPEHQLMVIKNADYLEIYKST